MATLPTKDSLSGPVSLRSGRAIATRDTTGIGRGIAAAGGAVAEWGADMTAQQSTVGISMAEAQSTDDLLGTVNRYEADPDYPTFSKRAPKEIDQAIDKASMLIADRRTRERWRADAMVRAARTKDAIADIGRRKFLEASQAGIDFSLQKNAQIASDPDTPDDLRSKVRGDMEGSIDVAEQTGLLSPQQAAERRERYLRGSDLTRGRLLAASNPDAIPGVAGTSANDMAKSLLRDSEGFRSTPYWDVTAFRAGYGSDTVTKADGTVVRVTPGMKITRADAERDLARRSKEFEATAQRQVGAREWGALPDNARAALVSVAYNYGSLPASVVNSVKAGDVAGIAASVAALSDDNDGVNAGRRAREAAIIRGEAGAVSEPDWYTRLSPEERQIVRDEASVRKGEMDREAAARLKATYTAHRDRMELDIMTGGVRSEQSIVSDAVLNDGDKASLLRTFRTQMADTVATNAAMVQFANGSLRVDPYDGDGRKLVDNVYKTAVAASPAAAQPIMEEAIRQTGLVPRPAFNSIRQSFESMDAAAVLSAARLASRINSIDPAALGRQEGGKVLQDAASTFDHYRFTVGLTEEQATRRMMEMRDPEKVRARAALLESKPVKDHVKTRATEDRVRGIFDQGFFSRSPSLGATPAESAAMVGEYRGILEESIFDAGGDLELADRLAGDRFKRRYGVSELALAGPGTVTRLPPEATYPAGPDGTHGYIAEQVREALAGEGVQAERVYLQADDITAKDWEAGRPARYVVFYEQDGSIERFNLPFYAVPSASTGPDLSQNRARWQENLDDMEAGRDREGTLGRFLDANPLTGGN